MSSIVKEFDSSNKTPGIAPANPSPAPRPSESYANKTQPVALEVSVTVNGVRTVEGGSKREPFSETSKTVLVFSNGAVIRLTATLSPGQLLFLTNEKTKKEVVCQVVKSKNYRNVSGYVELEFTEPVVGFWGMRFPNDHVASAPVAPPPVASVSSGPPARVPSVAERPVPPDTVAPAPSPALTAPPVPPAAPSFAKLAAPPASIASAAPEPPVSKPVELQIVKVESVAPSSPEVSASILEPSSSPEKKWEREFESAETVKLQTARLQEQLSSMLFSGAENTPAEVTAAPVEPVQNETLPELAAKVIEIPALQVAAPPQTFAPQGIPQAATSSLEEETIKIPSWLEPLARNTAAPATPQELIEKTKGRLSTEAEEPAIPQPASETLFATETQHAHEFRIPTFGSQLPMDENLIGAEKSSSSNNGFLLSAIAAAVFLLAGGGFWYMKQQSGSSYPAVVQQSPAPSRVVSTPVPQAPVASAPLQTSSVISSVEAPPAVTPSRTAPVTDASDKAKPIDRVTSVVSKVLQPAPMSVQPHSQPRLKPQPEPEPEPAKPSLGKIHLAAPKVKRQAGSPDSANGEPGLALGTEQVVPDTGSISGGLDTGNAKEPAAPVAPLPVGGDVKPAKLLTSVPPVYPTLARNQHIGGDVKIDALIDANGRVTSMKVLSGPTLLHQAAMDALRQWKYQPATLDGKPVPLHLTVTIQFRLQ